jgi:hypothetical protein
MADDLKNHALLVRDIAVPDIVGLDVAEGTMRVHVHIVQLSYCDKGDVMFHGRSRYRFPVGLQ